MKRPRGPSATPERVGSSEGLGITLFDVARVLSRGLDVGNGAVGTEMDQAEPDSACLSKAPRIR